LPPDIQCIGLVSLGEKTNSYIQRVSHTEARPPVLRDMHCGLTIVHSTRVVREGVIPVLQNVCNTKARPPVLQNLCNTARCGAPKRCIPAETTPSLCIVHSTCVQNRGITPVLGKRCPTPRHYPQTLRRDVAGQRLPTPPAHFSA
jgi:hypothetical protein